MNLLYWFSSIRNPFLDAFFSAITYLGHEIIPITIICVLYWCIDKKSAYKIGFSFFASGLTLQALKITFRIERPWIIDPNFKAVESAIPAATGYSFPSGHTQAATSLFSCLAIKAKNILFKILFVTIFILVGISRMYLGVHTPLDVFVSMFLTLILSFIVYTVIDKIYDTDKFNLEITILLLTLSVLLIIYSLVLLNSGIIEIPYVSDCLKAAGAGIGFGIGYYIERKYINFETKAPIQTQIIKTITGLCIALILKSGLKVLFGESLIGEIIRYITVVLYVLAAHPFIFKKIIDKRQ